MTNESDLIKKLLISKQIMDKHSEIPRTGDSRIVNETLTAPEVQSFQTPKSTYSIPEEFTQETKKIPNPQPITEDRVMSSRLPDEIKRLMIENPIIQPNPMQSTTLSDDLVEKASRLMTLNAAGEQTQKTKKPQQSTQSFDVDMLRSIVRETIEDVLKENGLLTESESKSNELITFKVGKHIFEGKVTKIKKLK